MFASKGFNKAENTERGEEFHRRVHADIDNYVACAYTFDEILQNVKPNLPMDSSVKDALEPYQDDKRVIRFEISRMGDQDGDSPLKWLC